MIVRHLVRNNSTVHLDVFLFFFVASVSMQVHMFMHYMYYMHSFMKVVDVYKKNTVDIKINSTIIGCVPLANTHMSPNTGPKTWGMPTVKVN